MMTMTRRTLGASALALVFAASLAAVQAQQPPQGGPPPVRIRGTIEKVEGNTVTVKARDGKTETLKLADNVRITAMVKATLDDIKVGSFIGVTGMPQPDGSQKAIALHIFMDAQRGVVPARLDPWDREPGSTMANADVTSTVAGVDGQVLMIKYADGEKKVVVPKNTPVVKFVPGNMGDVKPGAQMILIAGSKRNPDGTIAVPSINVGRDGVAPPM